MFIEDFDKMVEDLEANEDMVECKECFELFPKQDCFHFPGGYICPGCHGPEQEMPNYKTLSKSEDTSRDTTLNLFDHEFPDIMEYNPDSVMVPEPQEFPEIDALADIEPEVIDDPEDALEFLIKDEYDAIEGYELADEVIQHSSLDADLKGKILDTLAHIQEEEEEHIDELKALTLPKPQEPEDAEIIEPAEDTTASTHVLNEEGFEPVLDSEDPEDEESKDEDPEDPKDAEVLTEAPKFIDALRKHGKEAVATAGGFWKALRHPLKTGKLALLAEPLDKVFDGYKIVKFKPGSNSKIDTSFRPPVSSFPSFLKALQAIETIAKADTGSTYVLCVDTDPAKMTLVDGSTASQIKTSPQLVVYRGGKEDPNIGRSGLTRIIALLERDAKLKKLFGATVDTEEEEEPAETETETEAPPTPSEDPKARAQALRDAKRRLIEFNSFLKEVQKLKNPTGDLRAAVREFLKAYADAKSIILDPTSTVDDLSLDLGDLADNIDILDSYYDGAKTIIRDALSGEASPEAGTPEPEPGTEPETEDPGTETETETPPEPAITPKAKNQKVNRQIKGALKAAGIPDEILKQLKDTNMANLRKTLKQLLGESFKPEELDQLFEELEAMSSDN